MKCFDKIVCNKVGYMNLYNVIHITSVCNLCNTSIELHMLFNLSNPFKLLIVYTCFLVIVKEDFSQSTKSIN